MIDLKIYSALELESIINKVVCLIEIKYDNPLEEAFAKMEQMANGLDMDVDELCEAYRLAHLPSNVGNRAFVEPKYRSDTNRDDVWSGRGKVPKWLQVKYLEGRSLEEFLIPGKVPRIKIQLPKKKNRYN